MSWYVVETEFLCSKTYVLEADSSDDAGEKAEEKMCDEDAGSLWQDSPESRVIGRVSSEQGAYDFLNNREANCTRIVE